MSDKRIIVEARGKLCPLPVIETKKVMDENPQATIETIVDNEIAVSNVSKLGNSKGYFVQTVGQNGEYHIILSREATKFMPSINEVEKTTQKIFLITKDWLGDGNIDLGKTLMKTFLFSLAEAENKPAKIMFINSGVKLVSEGSENLDTLLQLSQAGVEIAACGICLDFYELKEKVAVGSITNMYAIVDSLTAADSVVL